MRIILKLTTQFSSVCWIVGTMRNQSARCKSFVIAFLPLKVLSLKQTDVLQRECASDNRLPHERLLQRALTSVLHQLAFVLSIANDKLRKNAC